MPFSKSRRLHDNHTLLARYYSQLAEQFPDLKKDNPDLATMSNLAQSESNAEETDAAFQEALTHFRKDYARYAMGKNAQWCGDNPAKCELEGMAARGVLTTGKIIGGTIDGVVGMAQHMGTRGNQVRDAVDVPVLGDALGVVGVAAGFVEASAVGLYHAFTDVLPSVGNAVYDSIAHPEYSNMRLAEEYAAATLNVQGVIGGAKGLKAGVPKAKALGQHLGDTWNGALDAVRNNIDSNGGMIPVSGSIQGGARTAAAAAATLPPLGNGLFGPLAVLMAAMSDEPPASGGGGAERPQPKVPVAVMKNENGLITGYKMSDGSVMDSPNRFAVMEDTYGSDYMRSLPDDIALEVPESLARVDDTVPAEVQLAADTDANWSLPSSPLGVLKNDTPAIGPVFPETSHPALRGLGRVAKPESATVVDGPTLSADDAVLSSESIPPAAISKPTTPRTLAMGSPSPITTPVIADPVRMVLEAIDARAAEARAAAVLPNETLVDAPAIEAAPLEVTPRGAAPLPPGGDLGATMQRPALSPAVRAAAPARTSAPATAVVPIEASVTVAPPPLPPPVALPAELPPPPAPRTPAPAAKAPTPAKAVQAPRGSVGSGPKIGGAVRLKVEDKGWTYRRSGTDAQVVAVHKNPEGKVVGLTVKVAGESKLTLIEDPAKLQHALEQFHKANPEVDLHTENFVNASYRARQIPAPAALAPTEAAPAVATAVPAPVPAPSGPQLPVPAQAPRSRGRRIAIWTGVAATLSGLAAGAVEWNNERKRVNRENAARKMLEQQRSGRKK